MATRVEDAPLPLPDITIASTPDALSTSQTAERSMLEPMEAEENNEAAEDQSKYPTGIKFFIVMLSIMLGLVTVAVDSSIISTAVPSITNHFGSVADIGWYYSASRLTCCSFQFMFGKVYSMFNAKRVFLVSLAIFECGSLLCASAPTSHALVTGRAVAGLGSSGIISGLFVMLAQCVPLRKRALWGAVAVTAETITSVGGPLLGGILTTKLNWRWCFWINLPLGFVTCAIIAIFLENLQVNLNERLPLKEKLGKLDLLGTLVFVPGITSLLLALQWGGSTYGWGNARIVVLFCAFMVGVIGFGLLQYKKQERATLPPRIVMQRSILSGALFCSLCNGSLTVVDYYMPIYFQAVRGTTAARSGVLTIPMIAGLSVSCLLAGTGITAVGYYTPFMLATSVIGAVAAGLMTTITMDTSLVSIVCYQALIGFGAGLGIQAPQVAAQTTLSQVDVSIGIAVIMFSNNLGPAIVATVAQSVFTSRLKSDLAIYAPQLNTTQIESMGLADLRDHIGIKNLERALLGYDKAITQTFYLPVAMMCLTMVGSLAMPWRSVKKKRE